MNSVSRFQELIAWQKARALTKTIYTLTRTGQFSRDFRLASQIQSASVSIMSNIAEGFERTSLKEFHQFLSIAKSSCAEVRSQLYVAVDAQHPEGTTFKQVLTQAEEVANIIGGPKSFSGT